MSRKLQNDKAGSPHSMRSNQKSYRQSNRSEAIQRMAVESESKNPIS